MFASGASSALPGMWAAPQQMLRYQCSIEKVKFDLSSERWVGFERFVPYPAEQQFLMEPERDIPPLTPYTFMSLFFLKAWPLFP